MLFGSCNVALKKKSQAHHMRTHSHTHAQKHAHTLTHTHKHIYANTPSFYLSNTHTYTPGNIQYTSSDTYMHAKYHNIYTEQTLGG